MKPGGRRDDANGTVGVLDAGVILTRLDPGRRGHRQVKALLAASARGRAALHISVVNLTEAIQHSRGYSRETGVDIVALLESFGVVINSPDVDVARRVAALVLSGASLADRFAVATAQHLRARLYTTDGSLAAAVRRQRITCSLL